MTLIPIPLGRSPNALVSERLLSQLQADQNDLLRVQTQVSSGKRLSVPSDDYPSALRAIVLQRSLQQHAQTKTNLAAADSYLSASDSAIASVSGVLSDLRGTALGAIGTTVSNDQRAAAATETDQAIQQLLKVANQQFGGSYLFGGTLSGAAPFTTQSGYVTYQGNEKTLQTIGGVDTLVDSSRSGQDVFGALSAEVRGTSDLNPVLTESTRLADLHGGKGVTLGSIALSDGVNRSVVDLSGAETVGDIVRRIEANPPAGRQVQVRLSDHGLDVTLVGGLGDGLTIKEVNGGVTANQLGILEQAGSFSGTVSGTDLDPNLTTAAPLANLFGVRANGILPSSGNDNDLVFEATHNGAANNGLTIQLVDDEKLAAAIGVAPGSEYVQYQPTAVPARASLRLSGLGNDLTLTANAAGTSANHIRIELDNGGNVGDAATATFDAGTNTLRLAIDDSGETTLASLVAAINGQGLFTAAGDTSAGETYDPAATVSAADVGVASGDTGNSGAEANTLQIFISGSHTNAAQVVAAVQNDATASALVTARVEGKDGSLASDPGHGLVGAVSTTLAGGSGSDFDQTGIRIQNGGQTFDISFATASTVQDVLQLLNGSSAGVVASINAAGNGIDIRSRLGGADFSIGELGGGTAAQLGLRTFTRETVLADLNYGAGVADGPGDDFTIQRSDGTLVGIDISGAKTIGDVIDLINQDADNQGPGQVVARLASFGNGIELVNDATGATTQLQVSKSVLSNAAWDLGLVPRGTTQATGAASGTNEVLTGADVQPSEAKGVFNTLARLKQALDSNDQAGIERAINLLDEDINRTTFARAEIGLRQQGIDLLKTRWDDENTQMQGRLSDEVDVDPVKAIMDMTNRQAAYQAALKAAGQTLQMTLLDFI